MCLPLAPRTISTFLGAFAVMGAVALGGCSPTHNVVSNTAKAALEDRLAEEQVVDAKIKAAALERLYDIDKIMAIDLAVDVWKTRLMLTGTLSSSTTYNRVDEAIRKDGRLTAVYNEVKLVTPAEQAQRREWKEKAQDSADKAAEVFDDFWIETKLSAKLIAAKGVSSVNYRWRSVLGTVYLIGEAESDREYNAVMTIIKDTNGVKAVKSHVVVNR